MIVKHTRFTDLSEVDFIRFFNDSLPYMDSGTYNWPSNVVTYEDKLAKVKSNIESLNNHFFYKITVDGVDTSIIFGYLKEDKFYGMYGFISPVNGSRSWIYDAAVKDSLELLKAEYGIVETYAIIDGTSPIANTIKTRVGLSDTDFSDYGIHGNKIVRTS